MKIAKKPVELIELFYDLLFVYAISQLTGLINEPVGGIIPPYDFFSMALLYKLHQSIRPMEMVRLCLDLYKYDCRNFHVQYYSGRLGGNVFHI